MSLRALPLMAIPLILYNLLVMFSGGEAAAFFTHAAVHDADDQGRAVGRSRAAT